MNRPRKSRTGQEPERKREPRWKLIARIRAQIAAGTYETETKLRTATDRLLRSINQERVE